MRVVSWNIQHLEVYEAGADSSALLEAALAELAPDILLLQEVDHLHERTGSVDQTGLISGLLPGLVGAAESRFVPTPPSAGNYGIAAVSRLPVREWRHWGLRGSPVGMWLTFMINGKPERFYCADHERALMTLRLDNGWLIANMHASFVPGWAHLMVWHAARWARAEARRTGSRLLFCGDLNLTSRLWLRMCGLRSVTDEVTFPAWAPTKQIDHLCVEASDKAVVSHASVHQFGISDHRAVVIDID
ncbi:MAG: hypothetical protein RL441_449 [Actinomycetota bacterium]